MRLRTFALVAIVLSSIVSVSCGDSPDAAGTGKPVVREGDAAPGFALPSAQGSEVSLKDYRGHTPVLLYFSMGPG
ncbi:MAG TPA: hypothetical protein VGS09_01515 [Actinomycetota bacterium]|nr:hypothetical protein [Actinomycetota bacterium]